MKKYRWIWAILVILLGVGTCTIISAQNYVEETAVVTITDSIPNSIYKQLDVMGALYYRDRELLELPKNCEIKDVFVKAGDNVEAGSAILQLEQADVQIQYLQLQLQKENLEKVQDAGGTQGELAYWQLQKLEKELADMEQLIADRCIVKAEKACMILKQSYKAEAYTGSGIVEVAYPEGGCYLTWKVNQANYLEYHGTALIGDTAMDLTWEPPICENGVYTYISEFPGITECRDGQPVEIQLNYVSPEYPAVVPKDCIRYDSNGEACIFSVYSREQMFGREYYVVKTTVDILEQDDTNVAVSATVKRVVERTTLKLTDMATVIVLEE